VGSLKDIVKKNASRFRLAEPIPDLQPVKFGIFILELELFYHLAIFFIYKIFVGLLIAIWQKIFLVRLRDEISALLMFDTAPVGFGVTSNFYRIWQKSICIATVHTPDLVLVAKISELLSIYTNILFSVVYWDSPERKGHMMVNFNKKIEQCERNRHTDDKWARRNVTKRLEAKI